MRSLRPILATAACAFGLAACGGGGGGSTTPPVTLPAAPASTQTSAPVSGTTANVVFHIDSSTIPTASTARRPAFVSPSTASVTIALQGQASPLATVNITTSSSACTTTSSGTQCSVTVAAPVGADTFVVTTWSGQNGTGSQLSSATDPVTVVQNATNAVSMTLGGVVASAAVLLGTTSVAVGTATSIAVNVVAYDAGGNVIVGPGNYTTPITVTDSDTSGATSLAINGQASGGSVSVPAPGTSVTLAYTGGTLQTATITPSVGGTTGTAATFTPTGFASVTYSLGALEPQPYSVVTGPGNQVWFGAYGIIGSITSSGSVTTYTSGLMEYSISGMAGSASGTTLWFGDSGGNLGSVSPAGINYLTLVSVPLGCGPGYPQSNPAATCGSVEGMVLDGAGNAWFTDADGLIGVITPAGVATEWDMRQIPGWIGGDTPEPTQVILGSDGALYVADAGGYVDRFTIANATMPTGVTQALDTACGVRAVAAGTDGNIWFADSCANIGAVPAGASGFASGNVNMWSIAGVTGNLSLVLSGSPGGVWGIDEYDNFAYRITNAIAAPGVPQPLITTASTFGAACANPTAIGLGPNGNIWVANEGAIAKIVYGAPAVGSQSVVRKLPPATHARAKNAGIRRATGGSSSCD